MIDKKIKICFVNIFAYQFFNPDFKGASAGGGAELQMSLVAKALAKDEAFDVHFAVLDLGQAKEETIDNVKLHAAYQRGRGFLNTIIAPFKLLLLLKKINPDVVTVRAIGVEAGICAFYCALFAKKFIYSVAHDDDLTGRFFKGLRGQIFKYGFFHAQGIVVQTEGQLEAIKKIIFKKEPQISLIRNSFPLNQAASNEKKDFILWVARGAADKRPEIFLRLAKDFPQEKFLMIMPRAEKEIWDSVSQELKNIPNLEFKDRTPFVEVEKYFSQAKVFVNTSSFEGFPNTFLQAAAAGVPILSLSIDPDGLLGKHKAGLVANDDYAILVYNLKWLLSETGLVDNLSTQAIIYMNEYHNVAKNSEKWKDTIRGLVK